jgi:hypothetical protein
LPPESSVGVAPAAVAGTDRFAGFFATFADSGDAARFPATLIVLPEVFATIAFVPRATSLRARDSRMRHGRSMRLIGIATAE